MIHIPDVQICQIRLSKQMQFNFVLKNETVLKDYITKSHEQCQIGHCLQFSHNHINHGFSEQYGHHKVRNY